MATRFFCSSSYEKPEQEQKKQQTISIQTKPQGLHLYCDEKLLW